MLVATMNPTPSGNYFDNLNSKQSFYKLQQYLSKLSQPLLDRIDLQIEVESVSINKLIKANSKEENNKMIKYRVKKARVLQYKRQGKINAHLENHEINKYFDFDTKSLNFLRSALESLNISARSFNRIKKISKTIADLNDCLSIKNEHVAEVLEYRSLERLKRFLN